MNVDNSNSRCSVSGQQSVSSDLCLLYYLCLLQVICPLNVLPYLAPFKWDTLAFFLHEQLKRAVKDGFFSWFFYSSTFVFT